MEELHTKVPVPGISISLGMESEDEEDEDEGNHLLLHFVSHFYLSLYFR